MSEFRFRAEDFDGIGVRVDRDLMRTLMPEEREKFAKHTNSLLESHLKTLPRVKGHVFESGDTKRFVGFDSESVGKSDTHTALLLDLKPLGEEDKGDA